MKRFINIFLMSAVLLMFSCRPETIHSNYLNLEFSAYTFGVEGGELDLSVDANVAWNVETDADWIETTVGEDNVALKVAQNDGAQREGTLTFTAEGIEPVIFRVSQMNRDFTGSISYLPDNMMMIYSCRGLYAIQIEMLRNEMGLPYFEIELVDRTSGESVPMDDLETMILNTSDIVGVSDMGHILYQNQTDGIYQVIYEGTATDLELPADYAGAMLAGISSDGTVVAGSAFKVMDTYNITVPILWVNGSMQELPIPDTDLGGGEMKSGAYVGGMSADGSVVWGYDNYNVNYSPVNGLMYWKNGELHYVGKETAEAVEYEKWGMPTTGYNLVRKMANPGMGLKISENGRYIIAEKNEIEVAENQFMGERVFPVLIDTETGEVKVFEDREDMCPFAVCDDGLILGADPYYSEMETTGAPSRGVMMTPDGVQTSVKDYFSTAYGVAMSDNMMMYRYFSEHNMYEGLKLTGTSMYGGVYQTFTIIPNK